MITVADKFLLAVLKSKDEKLLYKLKKEWLDSAETIRYRYILDYYKEHHELVGVKDYCSKFKTDSTEADSRPSLYLKELKDRYIFAEISEKIPALLKRVKANPREAVRELADIVTELNSDDSISKDVLYSERAKLRIEEYDERLRTGGISYIRFGNKVLDDIFYGLRRTDLVTFGGRAGSKKTFLLCFLAVIIEEYLPEDFGEILFVTNEVPAIEIEERIDAIRFKLPYGAFLGGKLTRSEYRKYCAGAEALSKKVSRLRIVENLLEVDELRTKMKLLSPSVVLLDGSYLMEPAMNKPEWEKVLFITRNLKRITNEEKIPIINTTQLKRASGKSEKGTSFDAQDDFAYGNSYTQDSDIAIRMFADKEMVYRDEVGLQVAKGRRVKAGVTPIFLANLNTMEFDFILTDAGDEEPPTELF